MLEGLVRAVIELNAKPLTLRVNKKTVSKARFEHFVRWLVREIEKTKEEQPHHVPVWGEKKKWKKK